LLFSSSRDPPGPRFEGARGADAGAKQPLDRVGGARVSGSCRDIDLSLGAGAAFKEVTFTSPAGITIRFVVGGLLVVLGLIQLNVLPISFLRVEEAARPMLGMQARLQREHPAVGFGAFGFGYLLAGFG